MQKDYRFVRTLWRSLTLAAITAGLSGCPGSSPTGGEVGSAGSSSPGATSASGSGAAGELKFWHTRSQEQKAELEAIVAEFNAAHAGTTIKPQFQGGYPQLFQKVTASIQTKQLPDLAVAYESMVADYMAADVLAPLDPLVADKEIGLSETDLADIFPSYLQTNRFAQFNNQLLSFPFTKSNLVMYYNKDRLKQAGFSKPPETWDEFMAQCRAIRAKTQKPAWAFALDQSTVDGIIFSYGGELVAPDQKSTRFDQPATVKTLELIARTMTEKLAYQVDRDTMQADFANQNATFVMGTSNAVPESVRQLAGKFDWDVAILPHDKGVKPVTVMYGANICVFKSDTAKERAAWEFIKYFTSTDVTARWAVKSGYLPVRKSAENTETLKQFFAQDPRHRRAYDMLPSARPEPNVAGWQEVRDHISEAVTSVISGTASPAAAAANLKQQADKAIAPR